MPESVNLTVIDPTGRRRDRTIGKVVRHPRSGRWVFHAWIHDNYLRKSQQAIGVRWPVIRFMLANGIDDIYLYNPRHREPRQPPHAVTFHTTLDQLRLHGMIGTPDAFGQTTNLPLRFWERIAGSIGEQHVPDEDVLCLPLCEASPWPTATQLSF